MEVWGLGTADDFKIRRIKNLPCAKLIRSVCDSLIYVKISEKQIFRK